MHDRPCPHFAIMPRKIGEIIAQTNGQPHFSLEVCFADPAWRSLTRAAVLSARHRARAGEPVGPHRTHEPPVAILGRRDVGRGRFHAGAESSARRRSSEADRHPCLLAPDMHQHGTIEAGRNARGIAFDLRTPGLLILVPESESTWDTEHTGLTGRPTSRRRVLGCRRRALSACGRSRQVHPTGARRLFLHWRSRCD
jgi:hypothetical protein